MPGVSMPEIERMVEVKKYKYTKAINYEGKRYYIRADTEKDLIRKEVLKLQQLENGTKRIEKTMLFKDWCAEWLETYKRPSVSTETFDGYVSCINCHILPYLGGMRLKDIKTIHIQKIVNNMAGGSKKMIDKVSYTTKQILEDAKRNHLLIENPAEGVVKPKGTAAQRRAITPTERKYILQAAENHRAGTWIYLMLFCGLRPAEACALQWRNVNLKERYLEVENAVKRSGVVGKPKTASGIRKIPITQMLLTHLEKKKADPLIPHGPFDYVVLNTQGKRVNASSMRKMWLSFEKELNIVMGCSVLKGQPMPPYRVADDLVPYCLRHTFCTDLQDAGVPINIAKELMGHSDISITAKIYTHQTEYAFNNAREMMDDLQRVAPTVAPSAEAVDILR